MPVAAVLIAFAVALSWWTLDRIKHQTREDIGLSLSATLHTVHTVLQSWAGDNRQEVASWAQSPILRGHVLELLELPASSDALLASPILAGIRDHLHTVIRNHQIVNFHILTRDYVDLATWDGEGVGNPSPLGRHEEFLRQVFSGHASFMISLADPGDSKDETAPSQAARLSVLAGAPIRNHFGEVIAALVFRLDPDLNFSRILAQGRMGRTEETYAFDKEGRVLAGSRFVRQVEEHLKGPLQGKTSHWKLRDPGGNLLEGFQPLLPRDRQPLTRMAASATGGKSGMDLDGYRDYRGAIVLGVWHWDKKLGIGLATEIGQDEAYWSFDATQNLVLLMAILLTVLFMVLAAVLATGRERALRLADEMTASLRVSHLALEDEVRERQKVAEELRRALEEAEQAQERIDGILKSISDGLIVTGAQNRVLLMNRAAREILGVRWLDAAERPLEEVVRDPGLRGKMISLLSAKTGRRQIDLEIPSEDPKIPRAYRARVSAVKDKAGKEYGTIVLLIDVTREHEIDRIKTEFITTAAHELRTPLTSIRGFSEILLTRDDIRPDERIKFLNYINRQAVHLSNIVNDLLDVSRMESEQGISPEFAVCNVEETVTGVIPYFQEHSTIHRFEADLPEKGAVWTVDREKIEQILKNLLSNAVKYSPGGGRILVKVQSQDRGYEVSVHDEGMGMRPEQAQRVFEKFYRGDASAMGIEGTGLGMTIVRNIVESHGGNVRVESQPQKGTAVTLFIPQPPVPPAAPERESS